MQKNSHISMILNKPVESRKSAQPLDAPRNPVKALLTNQVNTASPDFLCTSMDYTSFSRSTDLFRIILALVSMLLAACSHNAPAPVVDISSENAMRDSSVHYSDSHHSKPGVSQYGSDKEINIHLVKPGETLFSIAWRYSLDYQHLAKINQIKTNRIYPGQKLSLQERRFTVFNSETLVAAINKEVLHKKTPTGSQSSKLFAKTSHKKSVTSTPELTKSGRNNRNHAKNLSSRQRVAISSSRISSDSNEVKRWMWPVNGKIINHFSKLSNKNKGLDIVAKRGSPVRATAEGRVVYSGSGLRGYGRLVIIKHNDAFLSAYAHNDKIHVQENEFVKAGQRIADLGSSDSDKYKLHFEIRYKGKPMDPLNYLPKSGLL